MSSNIRVLILMGTIVSMLSCGAFSQESFRGILKSDSEPITSGAFRDLRPTADFHTDVRDDFTRETAGPLAGSEVDGTFAAGTRVGFVPPIDTRGADGMSLQGPLPSDLAAQHGTWMGHSAYTVSDGAVRLTDDSEVGVACLPWRVTPDLGDFYLIDAAVNVGDGETVSIAYFDDVETTDALNGLAGDLGLLVLSATRDGDQVDWEIKWEGEVPGSVSGSAGSIPEGQEINLQLGWLDNGLGTDLFDAWLDGEQLAAGDLGSVPSLGINGNIDVFAVGFELSGTDSSISSFAAAVPEPSGFVMIAVYAVGMLAGLRRRR